MFSKLSFFTIGRFCLLLSAFYIHLSFAGFSDDLKDRAKNVDPGQILKIMTQVVGQSEVECGSEYTDVEPTNEIFCSQINTNIDIDSHCLNRETYAAITGQDPPPTPPPRCSRIVGGLMEEVDQAVNHTMNDGIAVCHCCMVPSICLMGGIGRVIDLLRVGNYAGLLMGLNNNKICAAIEKTQHASMALDSAAGGKCLIKGNRCKESHRVCVGALEEVETIINGIVERCNGYSRAINCKEELGTLDDYSRQIENSSNRACGAATKAGYSQLGQAALTGMASLVARECKKEYERDTRCDDKKNVELDECCEAYPDADACQQNECEGKQGTELECCLRPQSVFCANMEDSDNVCHPTQLMNNADSCIDKCREDPTHSGCPTLCNMQWHNEVCPEVCKTYQMPRCAQGPGPGRNICESNSEDPCCVNPNGPACIQQCEENPGISTCQCVNNPGRCLCDREEDIPYMPEGQCPRIELPSTGCEDPNDPECRIGYTTSTDFPGNDGGDDGPANTANTPWPGPAPFADLGRDDSGDDGSATSGGGPTTYSPGGGGSSGGVGGLGGGGLGGGSGGGSDEGEGGEGIGEGEEDPYENILAGLSGDQNQGQNYGGAGRGGRGSSAGSSGFDLKKFLPKKKKDKKTAGKDEKRAPSSVDSIFDISSQMTGRYCENNNMNCIQK